MEDQPPARLSRNDWLLLGGVCLVFFCAFELIPHSLNVHQTVHCQNAREMLADGDWVIPHYGGRPWLERPPLPFWITSCFVAVLGDVDIAYELPPLLLGTAVVLLTAWMASVWFGRAVAVTAGMILATTREFISYATGPEADIFLCFLVTLALVLFVRLEFLPAAPTEERRFLGWRRWEVTAFFLVLGLTNLTKGLLFGTVLAVLPVAGFLLVERWRSIRRYVWLWGWLVFLAAALSWPILAYLRYPDVYDFWKADYIDRAVTEASPTHWYYVINLPWILVPWTLPALVGTWWLRPGTHPESRRERWFLFLWTMLPLAALSLSRHQHHHYLLHGLAPWCIFAAVGAIRLWEWFPRAPAWFRHPAAGLLLVGLPGVLTLILLRSRLPGPAWQVPIWAAGLLASSVVLWKAWACRHRPVAFVALLTVVCGLLLAIECEERLWLDHYHEDRIFLEHACETVPAGHVILVPAEDGALTASWWLHYGHGRTRLLHNVTFLRDTRLDPSEAYVIVRRRFETQLAAYGSVTTVMESRRSRMEKTLGDRYTLYRLEFTLGLARRSGDVRFSPLQATCREPGPYLE